MSDITSAYGSDRIAVLDQGAVRPCSIGPDRVDVRYVGMGGEDVFKALMHWDWS